MRNVHKQDFPVLILPQELQEEDRGLKVCATPRLALASIETTDQDKNDVFGVALICDDLTVELEHNGQTMPALGVSIPLPSQPNAKAFVIDWRLNLNEYGSDCYKVKVTYDIGGIVGYYYAGAYELLPYSVTASEGTTQIIARYGDLVRELGINFTGSSFITSIRVNGFFGDEQINSEHRNLTKANNTREKVRNYSQPTYNFTTRPISRCHTRPLKQILLNATELYLSDCNYFNHEVYKFRNVLLSDTSGIEMEGEEQRLKVVKCVFVDKIWQTESKYDYQVGQPPNISEIISNFCNFIPVTVNANSQLIANLTSGDTLDITIQNTANTEVGSIVGTMVTVPDATATITVNGTTAINETIASGVTETIALTVQNTATTQVGTISGTTVTVPDGTVNIQFNGTTQKNQVVASGVTANNNTNVVNSASVQVGTFSSGQINIADTPINLRLHSTTQATATAISAQSNNVNIPSFGQFPLQTGPSDAIGENPTLCKLNAFDNTTRFTALDGSQTYASGVIVDWRTWKGFGSQVLLYHYYNTTGTWAAANTAAAAHSAGGFTNWLLCPRRAMTDVCREVAGSMDNSMNYAPFNIPDNIGVWTGTERQANTSEAFRRNPSGGGAFAGVAKTNNTQTALFVKSVTVTKVGSTIIYT